MALELFGGVGLEAVLGEFLNAVLEAKHNAKMLKPKMEELEGTLEALYPVIKDIEELNKRLNGSAAACERETESIEKVMEDGKKLVFKCSRIGRWNLLKRSRYKEKLTELDNSLLRFHSLHMQAHMARDVKCSLLALRNVCFKLNLSPQCYTVHTSLEMRNNQLNFHVALIRVQNALVQFMETGDPTGFKVVREDHVDTVERYSEDDDKFMRKEWFKIKWRLNKVSGVLHDINSRIQSRNSVALQCQRSDQNALRISECNEMKENEFCEGSNLLTHNTEFLALPSPLPSDHETTSGGDHNINSSSSNNGSGKYENESKKPILHILEATAAKLDVATLIIIVLMLLCCFNLVMTFLIFMFK